MSEQVERLTVIEADFKWPDDEVVVRATDYDALHAEAEALRAENGRLEAVIGAFKNGYSYERLREERDSFQREGIRAMEELEAARGLLERAATCMRDAAFIIDSSSYRINGAAVTIYSLRTLAAELNATTAPEVPQDESLDDRLRQAGMLSVAELLNGAPLDAFIKHAGVHDLATLLQWAEMRRGECLRMMARYDLGEKDEGDDLYEWTVAHCAVFTELHVNLRAALAEQGERQEAGDMTLTPDAQKILTECIGAHAYVLQALVNGRPDLALTEAKKWVDGFKEAADHHRQAQQGGRHES